MIVKSDKIIARGVHHKHGQPHAEPTAINTLPADFDFSQTEIYITLEPCDTFSGKNTPSCTELLLKIKPKKIIVGSLDPKFNGQNLEKLKAHGINAEFIENEACQKLNEKWFHWKKYNQPFWHLKMAATLDGKISSANKPQFISNKKSRQQVHKWRSESQTILTTTETILSDNPWLDVRGKNFAINKNSDLIILGKRKIPRKYNIFEIENRKIFYFKTLNDFLNSEKYQTIDSIFTECGAQMATEILKQDLADRFSLFIAPKFFGDGKNIFTSEIADFSDNYKLDNVQQFDDDLLVEFKKI